jgi:cytochrome c-type biogenesis protein CcmH
MIAVAVLILILPLLKKTNLPLVDGKQRNLKIARQQLAELKQQLQDGRLLQHQFDAQYQELQANLNNELDHDNPVGTKAGTGSGRWMIPIIILFLPLLSLALYVGLGDPDAMRKIDMQQEADQQLSNVRMLIPQIIERLKQSPEDLDGWLMLGRSYMFVQNYPAAKDVFAKIYQFQPDNVEVMLNYANCLAMNNNGQLAGEPAELIEKAVKKAPDNSNALWLAGMAKAEEGDSKQALTYWHKLLMQLPPESDGSKQVQQMIAELAAQEANTEADAGTASQASVAITTRIQVSVDIAPAQKAGTQPQQTVFIYAQALNGPKMPLAIVRKKLADLPLTVELNDSMAMQPGMHLADFKRLKIVARVSKSGDAIPKTGDLIGSSELNVTSDTQAISLLINQEVP